MTTISKYCLAKCTRSVTVTEPVEGYPILQIAHPKCSARVAIHGAHVMSWKPTGREEALYLSPDAVFEEGTAIRGGVPVCWPWFGAHATDSSQPSHGLVRTRFWNFVTCTEDQETVTLRLEIREGNLIARLTIIAGEKLELRLNTKNESKTPVAISGALHTYLAASNIDNVIVKGLDGAGYLETVGKSEKRTQRGSVVFNSEVDRVYYSTKSLRLVDTLSGKTTVIEQTGSSSTIVWNPWVEKSKRLIDMPDEDYLKFCCIEAAITNDMAEKIMPSSEHNLMTRVSVEN